MADAGLSCACPVERTKLMKLEDYRKRQGEIASRMHELADGKLDQTAMSELERLKAESEANRSRIRLLESVNDEQIAIDSPVSDTRGCRPPVGPAYSGIETPTPTPATRTATPTGRDFRSLFGASDRTLDRGGFKDFGEFVSVLASGRHDPRLAELRAMYARMHPALHEGAIWLANPTTLPQLMMCSFPVGTGVTLHCVPPVRCTEGGSRLG
jgi:hypothetical protein